MLIAGLLFLSFSKDIRHTTCPPTISIIDSLDIEKKLLNFNYKKFRNRTIDDLLKGIDINYDKIIFVKMKPLYLSFVTVVYSPEISLDIYTEQYRYLKRELYENESYDLWKIEDLLKEKVSKIRVRKRNGATLKEYPRKPILPVV